MSPAHCVYSESVYSALGVRVLSLSRAFHQELLSDEQILDFSEELAECCERLAGEVGAASVVPEQVETRDQLVATLESYVELAETFDRLDESDCRARVEELERRLTAGLLATEMAQAA